MAKLQFDEKQAVEKLLGMSTGYVSDFSNRTFQMFIGDYFNIDIYDEKYSDNGDSKANRLRCLFEKESDYLVSQVIEGLLEHQIAYDQESTFIDKDPVEVLESRYDRVRKVINRLKSQLPVENVSVIKPILNDTNFTLLAESVRKSIEQNNPIEALDRLHTYMVRYVRNLCTKHSIQYSQSQPLNAIFGQYVRKLKEGGRIKSTMTLQILGAYVKLLDEFNDVRNNESLAHDNDLIKENEALLILNSIANLIRFVDQIEIPYKQ